MASPEQMANTSELAKKLDAEFDKYVEEMKEKARKNPRKPDDRPVDEIIEELANHPAIAKEIDLTKPLTSDYEGLMALKYEQDDPCANAEGYKDDGNVEFQKKKYKIAIDNYTAGIKLRCDDRNLNAVLYCNRAAAQYHIGNFRSSFNDCIVSRKFKPDHFKAIHRGAMCCMEIGKYQDCMRWCDDALLIDGKNAKILELRQKADKLHRAQERDRRKEEAKERKERAEESQLINTIKSRGIHLGGVKMGPEEKGVDPSLLASIETHNPSRAKVHLDPDGFLHWPVMFMYPEYTETDFIEAFNENSCFIDHLLHMFGPAVEPSPWDVGRKYTPESINVYFEDRDKETLHRVDKESTLLQTLRHKRYTVFGGTPCFILTSAGSAFEMEFLKKYKIGIKS